MKTSFFKPEEMNINNKETTSCQLKFRRRNLNLSQSKTNSNIMESDSMY